MAVAVVVVILGIVLQDYIETTFAEQQCDFVIHWYSPFLNKSVGLFKMVVLENVSDSWGLALTMMEEDLLTVLKELHEASLAMTNGKLHSASDLERYNRAIEWSKRVITLAERSE